MIRLKSFFVHIITAVRAAAIRRTDKAFAMQEFSAGDGQLEVICGPMFSGKSEELIRRIRRVQISGKPFLLFKPRIDSRYDPNSIISHDARKLEAIPTGIDRTALAEIEKAVAASSAEVIAFDEVHFYDPMLAESIKRWVGSGKRVIASGLDMDFRGEPIGPIAQLLAIADDVDKLKAICAKCKSRPAVMSQRIVNGRPAGWNDPTILVGAADRYEPRCRKCHEIVRPTQA